MVTNYLPVPKIGYNGRNLTRPTIRVDDGRAAMKQSIIDLLPPEVLARQLVAFDVECVSWLHW